MGTAGLKVYRIHPGIGIARVGNSREDDFYIGPEVPDFRFVPPPDGNYRNGGDQVRREGCRFRIYEYTYADASARQPESVREITAQDAEIKWTVHLANLKSYYPTQQTRFPNDPGPQPICGINQRAEVAGKVGEVPVQLGTLLTDDAGRLVVLGGFGEAGPFKEDAGEPSGIWNAGWYDDTSDGPVQATLVLPGCSEPVEAEPAWVIASVPSYATPTECIVTLYDLAYEMAIQQQFISPPAEVSFFQDIYPVLFRAVMSQWVTSAGRLGHSRGKPGDFLNPQLFDLLKTNSTDPDPLQKRTGVFGKLKKPDGTGGNMPALSLLAVTPRQYECFRQWAPGNFIPDWPAGYAPDNPPRPRPFYELSPLEQTIALDRAGLESSVGGSFNPGIEGGRVMGTPIYEAPFRIDRTQSAGTLTASLSIPWQADFRVCTESWWPSARPGSVTGNGADFHDWVPFGWGNRDMVEQWWRLGFLKGEEMDGAPIYVERERLADTPDGIALGDVPIPDEDVTTVKEAEAFVARMVAAAAARRNEQTP